MCDRPSTLRVALMALRDVVGAGVSILPQSLSGSILCIIWPLKDQSTGELRVVVINSDLTNCTARLNVANGLNSTASITRLVAPALTSLVEDIRWGGMQFSAINGTIFGNASSEYVAPAVLADSSLDYWVSVPNGTMAYVRIPQVAGSKTHG